MRLYLMLIIMTVFLFSCSEEDVEEAIAFPDLKIYLDRFEEEARLRGYDFDLSQINARYVDEIVFADGSSACGIAYDAKNIGISRSEGCNWANRTDIERENLFFHEIGHAFLRRTHEETKMCDGSPVTIMTSTTSNFRVYLEGETEKREYYISELIDRIVAADKCIRPLQNWSEIPVLYDFKKDEEDWIFFSNQDNYSGTRISNINQSFGDQLTIKSDNGDNADDSGYWYTQFINPNIPECAKVTFKVQMNSEMLTGPGAAIAVRVYEKVNEKDGAKTKEFLFLTTEDKSISGKLENHIEELTIPCFTRKTTNITVFVVMVPGTEGEVSFDDIQLLVE